MLSSIVSRIAANRSYLLFSLWLLLIFTFVAVIKADYILFDENVVVLANPLIKASLSIDSLVNIFSSFETNQYSPLSVISFWLEYNFFGFNSTVSHLINLLLHMGCATMVFFLATSLTESAMLGWLIAALWSVHPVQVETVAWVLERRNLLYGLFYFASLVAYAQYIKTERRRDIAVATALMLFSGLSKTLAFFMPFTWLLMDWLKSRPFSWKLISEKTFAFLLAAILLCVTFYAAQSEIVDSSQGIMNWRLAAYNIGFYAARTLIPVSLTATYEINSSSEGLFNSGPLYFAVFVVTAIIISLRSRLAAFALLFYVFHILPLSGFIRVGYNFYAAMHFMYVAMFGIVVGIIALIKKSLSLETASRYVIALSLLVVLSLSLMSHSYCLLWNNSQTLFEHCLKQDPANRFARNQLALFLLTKKLYKESKTHYQELVVRYPEFSYGYFGLGRIFMAQNKADDAMMMFDQAMKYDPKDADIPYYRGTLLFLRQKFRAAEIDFSESLGYQEDLQVRFLRSEARRWQGKYSGAVDDLVFITHQDPHDFGAKVSLLKVLVEGVRWQHAFETMLAVFSQIADNRQSWQQYRELLCSPSLAKVLVRMMPYRTLLISRLGWYPF